jgi:hypothetical protein
MTGILSPCFCSFFPSWYQLRLYFNIVTNTCEHNVLSLLAVTVQIHTFKIACLVLASVCGHSIDPIYNLSLLHVACVLHLLVGKVSDELIFIILM